MPVEKQAVRLLAEAKDSVTDNPAPPVEQPLTYACWLSTDVLFLTLATGHDSSRPAEASAVCGTRTVPLAARGLPYDRSRNGASSGHFAQAVLVRLPPGHTFADELPLAVRVGGLSVVLGPPDLKKATVSLDTLLRFELAPLESVARTDLLAFFVEGPGEPATPKSRSGAAAPCCTKAVAGPTFPGRLQLSRSLHTAREALRERLPKCVISASEPQSLNVDAVFGVDDRNFYVQGWLHDEQATPSRLTAISPEGCRTEILPHLYRYPRPDVEKFYGEHSHTHAGFDNGWIAHFETSVPSLLSSGWTFELTNAAGSEVEASGPAVTWDMTTVREAILYDLRRERLPDDRLRAGHIAPALTRLEERRRSSATVESIDQHGHPPTDPDVSIVVPLYGRIDFVEHQLAQFVHDPELQRVDLIYILDSPELADAFRVVAGQLADLYRVPFRAVVMSHNVGFSGVNNIGADLAKGRLLLLLNSDVFPRTPGWIAAMATFYDANPDIGALAPKLLYEDDSIQHAGLYFRRLADTGLWNNEHYYKGLHRNLAAANLARVVPAVTAACMMVDLALYRQMGGLRGMYIQGDYEDSDLCLRLSEKGHHSWYLPTVELYHLEGQSYLSATRQHTGTYNQWLHTAHWATTIEGTTGNPKGVPTL